MTKNEIDDLKQFITATVTQTVSKSDTRLETKIDRRFEALETKIDEGFAGVADAIDRINNQLDSHETRITGLEKVAQT